MFRGVNRSCANCNNSCHCPWNMGGVSSDISFCDDWEDSRKYWTEVLNYSEAKIDELEKSANPSSQRYLLFWKGVKDTTYQVLDGF
ncbi:hypothetical protein F9B85_05670 [Heliorestis acidaminivorans]|uniref:Uncharacterized protein n=1 Tax=Heliorestis acidaminivorans TaxID=553427 RepID=A0A6I0F3U4_9FIRM|nr:hypothetical protein [Heliorestis acidaminivorans]KAB2953397.1 hypothetical protein F9B85_05670 [Heliorestis acidaminivorans]